MMTPDLPPWYSLWNWRPGTWIGAAVVVCVYLIAIGPTRKRYFSAAVVKHSQIAWFILGIITVLFAQVSPLDALSDEYLFSAHMAQHMLLTAVAPPLLLLGLPDWILRPILQYSGIKRIISFLTNPIFAFLIFNINFLIWHFPAFYEATLENELIHFGEHTTFLVTALLFWWPIFSPTSDLPRLSNPFQVLYLFLAAVPSTILGALIIFSPTILYETYVNAPRITVLDPMADQQIAGVLMAMLGSMIYLGVLSVVFFKWLNRDEKLNPGPGFD
ncbi:MAG: cytochrome c oxidase assembly protein [Planctomycetes bacterium]|nr:cytochrome c oxidase assembly protein [Planctomycetota bacterium]